MLGEKISYARRYRNYGQKELANLYGCTVQQLSNWEREFRKPKIEVVEKIADILDIRLSYFIDRMVPVENIQPYLKKTSESAEALEHDVRSVSSFTDSRAKRIYLYRRMQRVCRTTDLIMKLPEEDVDILIEETNLCQLIAEMEGIVLYEGIEAEWEEFQREMSDPQKRRQHDLDKAKHANDVFKPYTKEDVIEWIENPNRKKANRDQSNG